MPDIDLQYDPSPTLDKFHLDDTFVRVVTGPIRSGKSTGMCMEILQRILMQEPQADGVCRSRWVVIRNTYRELEDTTLTTWLLWIPEKQFGKFNNRSMTHKLRFKMMHPKLSKLVRYEADVMFRALDIPDDRKKLLSLEVTGGWVNEAREVPKAVIDTLTDRVGQYPPMMMGGPTWYGVILDTNPPDTDHWLYRLAEEEKPDNWSFYKQPGGLMKVHNKFVANPDAENIEHLKGGYNYYLKRLGGKSKDYILVYYCGEYGFAMDGVPILPEYADHMHCARHDLELLRGLTVYVGLDFGLTPAAVFGQKTAMGQWRIFHEIVEFNMSADQFGKLRLGPYLRGTLREFLGDLEIYGDPAGNAEAQTDKNTVFNILNAQGIPAEPAPSNDFDIRREAIAQPLSRVINGEPGLIISPKVTTLRKGMAGGYCYKRIQVAGQERYHNKPDKNMYSHVTEACGYMLYGAGEGEDMIEAPYKGVVADVRPPVIPMDGDKSLEWMGR